MSDPEQMNVEVAYARPDVQVIIQVRVAEGSTAEQAVLESNILGRFVDIDLKENKIGVFGKHIGLDTVLREGDRVEIYRPLIADPKEIRRQRANSS